MRVTRRGVLRAAGWGSAALAAAGVGAFAGRRLEQAKQRKLATPDFVHHVTICIMPSHTTSAQDRLFLRGMVESARSSGRPYKAVGIPDFNKTYGTTHDAMKEFVGSYTPGFDIGALPKDGTRQAERAWLERIASKALFETSNVAEEKHFYGKQPETHFLYIVKGMANTPETAWIEKFVSLGSGKGGKTELQVKFHAVVHPDFKPASVFRPKE